MSRSYVLDDDVDDYDADDDDDDDNNNNNNNHNNDGRVVFAVHTDQNSLSILNYSRHIDFGLLPEPEWRKYHEARRGVRGVMGFQVSICTNNVVYTYIFKVVCLLLMWFYSSVSFEKLGLSNQKKKERP